MIVKILAIEKERVSVGLENGSMKYVDLSSFSQKPSVGQEFEGFEDQAGKMLFIPYVDKKLQGSHGDDTTGVNKMTYCLLALFLGGFGAHKFYAGKKLMGVIYILLFPVFGISVGIAFIEGLFGLAKKADAYGNIKV